MVVQLQGIGYRSHQQPRRHIFEHSRGPSRSAAPATPTVEMDSRQLVERPR